MVCHQSAGASDRSSGGAAAGSLTASGKRLAWAGRISDGLRIAAPSRQRTTDKPDRGTGSQGTLGGVATSGAKMARWSACSHPPMLLQRAQRLAARADPNPTRARSRGRRLGPSQALAPYFGARRFYRRRDPCLLTQSSGASCSTVARKFLQPATRRAAAYEGKPSSPKPATSATCWRLLSKAAARLSGSGTAAEGRRSRSKRCSAAP